MKQTLKYIALCLVALMIAACSTSRELEKNTAATLNFSELSEKAESIFTNLTDTHCGIIADESGEYIILVANTKKDLTDSEKQVIENWLITESGIAKAKLLLNLNR